MQVNSYRDLEVWQVGMALAERCYTLTRRFPREEMFGMVSQIRRSAASVPANIAEGYGRDQTGDYVRMMKIAQGSLKELETHVLLAQRVGLAESAAVDPVLVEADRLGRMLRSLIRSVEKSAS